MTSHTTSRRAPIRIASPHAKLSATCEKPPVRIASPHAKVSAPCELSPSRCAGAPSRRPIARPGRQSGPPGYQSVSYTHLRAHETPEHLVCRLLLEKKKN